VVVDDPLAVRTLRKVVADRGYKVWEADIKYFLNYIYDNLLIPGRCLTRSPLHGLP